MGGHEVLGLKAQELVDASNQDLRIAILLATNGEDVKERRPHEIVDTGRQFGEPERHGVIGIAGCVVGLDAQTGDGGR